jgi:hypothetical protein
MLDINYLSRLPHQVVSIRPDDDLPCDVCGLYGGVVIVKINYETYDLCELCAKTVGIDW